MTKADAKRALAALDEVILEELGNAQKARIAGLVQLTVRVKPAKKSARAATRPRARRSRSPPSPPASTSALGRSRRREGRPAIGAEGSSPPRQLRRSAAQAFVRRPCSPPAKHNVRKRSTTRTRPPAAPGRVSEIGPASATQRPASSSEASGCEVVASRPGAVVGRAASGCVSQLDVLTETRSGVDGSRPAAQY